MAFTFDARNSVLDTLFGTGPTSGTWASLHTADPTTSAATALANEAIGGSPAYARKQVNYNASVSGIKSLATSIAFDITAGTYTHYALWKVSSGGTQAQLIGSSPLDSPKIATVQDTLTITSADVRD